MPHRSHLPVAVIYPDERALSALALGELTVMLSKCDRWFLDMESFRAALVTNAGRTEWMVLTRQDIADATAARGRVRNEIDRRQEARLPDLGSDRSADG